MVDDAEPRAVINLQFQDGPLAGGRVPITVVAEKLAALQTLVFHAAATVARDDEPREGRWVNRYRERCELIFEAAHRSDLVITARLADTAERLQPGVHLGFESLDLVFRAGRALSARNEDQLRSLQLSRHQRKYLLRAYENLCPGTTDEYSVQLSNGRPDHPPIVLDRDTRRFLRATSAAEPSPFVSERELALVGTLTKIHVDVGPLMIAVKTSGGAEIVCFYDISLRDQIANLVAGSIVEVRGMATFNPDGSPKQVDSILDVEMVSTEPLRMSSFTCDHRRYSLKRPIAFDVSYADGVWVYEHQPLSLIGYGERREDAVRDLHETFDYVWRAIAKEQDAHLDNKAIEVKKALLDLVAQDEEVG